MSWVCGKVVLHTCFQGELSNNYSLNTVDLCPVGADEHRLSFQDEGLVFKESPVFALKVVQVQILQFQVERE